MKEKWFWNGVKVLAPMDWNWPRLYNIRRISKTHPRTYNILAEHAISLYTESRKWHFVENDILLYRGSQKNKFHFFNPPSPIILNGLGMFQVPCSIFMSIIVKNRQTRFVGRAELWFFVCQFSLKLSSRHFSVAFQPGVIRKLTRISVKKRWSTSLPITFQKFSK